MYGLRVLVVAALMAAGCGSSDDDGSGGFTPPPAGGMGGTSAPPPPPPGPTAAQRADAQMKCNGFIDAYCYRIADCCVLCTREGKLAECRSSAREGVDCGKAVAVGESYARCIADIQAATCSSIQSALPASCNGVVKVTE